MAQCECGAIKEYRLRYIKKGHTRSCGCIVRPHGYFGHPLYKVWQSMKERCYNQNHQAFKRYGGRGILMCDDWKNVVVFIKWALNNGWKEGLEIDRVDNNKGYYPENCRCVTRKVNSRNRNCVIKLICDGIEKTLPEWAELYNNRQSILRSRLRQGWSAERAIKTSAIDFKPKAIRQLSMGGALVKLWPSMHDLKKSDFPAWSIWKAIKNGGGRRGDYRWEYA